MFENSKGQRSFEPGGRESGPGPWAEARGAPGEAKHGRKQKAQREEERSARARERERERERREREREREGERKAREGAQET